MRNEPSQGECSAPSETVILFYTTMWDLPLDMNGLPESCRLITDRRRIREADAVVFHIPTLRGMPPRKRPGQLWVAWSMECDVNYPRLRNPDFMSRFDLTMTYRLDADVVATYTAGYGDTASFTRSLRTLPAPKSAERLATMFISSGVNRSGRIEYATELMRYLDIHSYGQALNNRSIPPPDRGRPTKLEIIAGYKFNLAFENAIGEDYVTEKFFDPLTVGTVPVYLGAPNIDTFAPGAHCFINTAGFSSPRELADYLHYLNANDAEYAQYFAWKDRPFRPGFQALLMELETPPFARLCKLVRAWRDGQAGMP
jgi:hypothetical protein